jgi:Formyl transferase
MAQRGEQRGAADSNGAIEASPSPLPREIDFSLNRLYYQSCSAAPALRLGLLLDNLCLKAFARAVLLDLLRCSFVNIVGGVRNGSYHRPPPMTGWGRARRLITDRKYRSALPFALYLKTLDRRAVVDPDPDLDIDCSAELADVEIVAVQPVRTRWRDRMPTETIDYLRALNLDVLLRFGFGILTGDVLRIARHGVWSYHHGDSAQYRGGPAHLWELIEAAPVSGVTLQLLAEELDAGVVISKSLFQTVPTLALRENRFGPYWSTTHFVIQALHTLHSRGPAALQERLRPAGPYRGRRPIYRAPGAWDLAKWLVPKIGRRVARRMTPRRTAQTWRVAIRRAATPLLPDFHEDTLRAFRWIENPRGRWLADPFLIHLDGRTWLFVEDFDESVQKGTISVGEVSSDGSVSSMDTALVRPYHLSYPLVFSAHGELFMVPDSAKSGAVELYRARRFPTDWVLEARLLELRAVDSTLFERNGRYWMFVSPMPVAGYAAVTQLFSAPTVTGPWKLHPVDPITSDVRDARGAGAVFVRGEKMFRPAQDCGPNYGHALVLHEIERLDEQNYSERAVARVGPGWLPGLIGVHTYNHAGPWEVIDGSFRVPAPGKRTVA